MKSQEILLFKMFYCAWNSSIVSALIYTVEDNYFTKESLNFSHLIWIMRQVFRSRKYATSFGCKCSHYIFSAECKALPVTHWSLWFFQILKTCSNLSEIVNVGLNLSNLVYICPSLFKFLQTCSKLFKTCSNLFKLVQTCSNLFKLVWNCSNWFKPVLSLASFFKSILVAVVSIRQY